MTKTAPAKNLDGRHARSLSTRESIILTAERMFAEQGIANVSLRDIGLAAGQKNNGAVQYHFGDRDKLVSEVRKYRALSLEETRGQLLAEIALRKGEPQVRDYVKAFVDAMASILDNDNYYLRFLARLAIEAGSTSMQSVPQENLASLRSKMLELLPHLNADVLDHRWEIMVVTTVHTFAGYQTAIRAGTLPGSPSWLLGDLVDFLTAALQAPISGEDD